MYYNDQIKIWSEVSLVVAIGVRIGYLDFFLVF